VPGVQEDSDTCYNLLITLLSQKQMQTFEVQLPGFTPIILPIAPVPKPRMTQSDRWKQRECCLKYWQFKDELRRHVSPDHLPESLYINFVLPMPNSWSKKKKQQYDGQPHKQRPDWDNLAKAFFDALFEEDSHICNVRVSKIWGKEGRIIVRQME